MSLPEALYIVSQNAHGVKHNYALYNVAICMVNARYPHPGHTVDDDDESAAFESAEWARAQDDTWTLKHSR